METRTPIQLSPWADATVLTNGDWLLPLEPGQAVSPGWPSPTGPVGVTWHWAATWDLLTCSRVLGGKNPLRKGQASAHYAVGRSSQAGVNQYVTLENRSWHAGIEQLFRWDGQALTSISVRPTSGTCSAFHLQKCCRGSTRMNRYPTCGRRSAQWLTGSVLW